MNNKLFLILILFGLLGWGCAKPYPQFYHDETNGFDVTTSPLYEVPDGEPKVINSNFANIENDDITMFEDGYIRLGYSSFNAKHYGEHGAISQAKKVHASVVIIYSRYINTASGSVPITTPNDQSATYWIKIKDSAVRLGVHIIDLTPEARQATGSNKGMLILAVLKNSPAFHADIINGDILRRVGENEIYDLDSYLDALGKYAGTETQVVVWRKGNEIKKSIKLNP